MYMNTTDKIAGEAQKMSRADGAPSLVLAAVTAGITIASGMWILWWLLHHPALATPLSVAGPLLLVAMLSLTAWVARWYAGGRIGFGALAGLVSGLINLMLLGSMISKAAEASPLATDTLGTQATGLAAAAVAPGVQGVGYNSVLVMLGFVALSAAIGALGGVVARAFGPATPLVSNRQWLARLSAVVAISIVPLLFLGGLVTSAAAGLSVPDWPGTFGANMFFYPLALMESSDPRIFKEHTHRLFGALIGLITVALCAALLRYEPRRWVKVWGCVAVLLVIAQGLLGASWVVEQMKMLAVVHGVLGQLFFASMVALAVVCTPAFIAASGKRAGMSNSARTRFRAGPKVAWLTIGAIVVQLGFGATYRHLRGQTGANHALLSHIVFSFIVMALVLVLGIVLMKLSRRPELEELAGNADAAKPVGERLYRLGIVLHGVVALQFTLGWVAWLAVSTSDSAVRISPTATELATTPAVPTTELVIRTLHQINGALLLGAVVLAATWVLRLALAAKRRSAAGESGNVLAMS